MAGGNPPPGAPGIPAEPRNQFLCPRKTLYRAGSEREPRPHRPTGGGLAIVEALHGACRASGVEFALGNRVDDLIVRDGRAAGVRPRGEELTAHAVIITTGGFGSNPELV